jgi:transposase-like protein
VTARAQRRRFTAADKRRIVAEADACTKRGQIGALLRREGVYSSQLSTWRKQREQGELTDPTKRGRPAEPASAELQRLQRENERLRRELEKARFVIDVQKKLSQVLGLEQAEKDDNA